MAGVEDNVDAFLVRPRYALAVLLSDPSTSTG